VRNGKDVKSPADALLTPPARVFCGIWKALVVIGADSARQTSIGGPVTSKSSKAEIDAYSIRHRLTS
jgi:hypothetical protein